MSARVVDTSVFSLLFKQEGRAQLYAPELAGHRLHLSFLSVGELRRWALQRQWGPRRMASLQRALLHYDIIGFDDETAWRWAEIAVAERRAGRNRQDFADWWIAACAVRYDMPLVTHNPRDFVGIAGLQVITHAPPISS